ncbi:unnamed protein product, partial [Prorocentrum cordatum]
AELAALTQAFGALDASQWMSLHEAVSTERFADCGLQLADGQQLRAHGAIVTSRRPEGKANMVALQS